MRAGLAGYAKSTVLGLALLAFALRLALMLALHTYEFRGKSGDDMCRGAETAYIAASIVKGRGFASPFGFEYTGPTAWIGPVYPYMLAAVYALYGVATAASSAAIFGLQAFMSALTVVAILGIAALSVGRRAGLIAGCAWALFPWFSKWAVTWEWDMSMSALLLAVAVWSALALDESSPAGVWVGQGLLHGFALLANPALACAIPVSLAWQATRGALRGPLLSLAVCLAAVSPWMVRNRLAFHEWVFLRGNFGEEFALGNYHDSNGRGLGGPLPMHPISNAHEYASYKELGERAYVRRRWTEAVWFVRRHPGEFMSLTAARVVFFWDGSAMIYRTTIAPVWLPWSFMAFSLASLAALLVAKRTNLFGWQVFLGILALYPLPYYLTFSYVRYRHAIEPLMLLLVAYAAEKELIGLLKWKQKAFVYLAMEAK